jgi:2'-5' RNA ligase
MAIDHFLLRHIKDNQVDWNFNVVFEGQPAVAEMSKQYAPAIQHPGLYKPIPPQWMHATILSLGTVEDFTEQEVQAVAAKLEPILARLELPEFNFDSWWLWGGNVVLHISPEDEFTKIYDAVISALESVVGPERTVKTPHGKFIAHTSLAYTRSHDKEHELHNQLVAHPVTPVSFKVGYLPLLRQWAHDGHYEWEVIKKIPIGKGS